MENMSLTAGEMLNYRALHKTLFKLEKLERREKEELARENEELQNVLKAGEKPIASLKEVVRGARKLNVLYVGRRTEELIVAAKEDRMAVQK